MGTVGMRLTVDTGETEYRLRDAVFAVEGPESAILESEDDPAASTLTAELAPGEYTITLGDGWRLERSSAVGFEDVDAALASAETLSFEIQSSESTTVHFRFLVEGVVIEPEPPANWVNVLGFEDPGLWSSDAALSSSNTRVEGQYALAVSGGGYHRISSVPLAHVPLMDDRLRLALRLPREQANPYWYGAVEVSLDAPSVGLSNVSIGSAALTGLPLREFVDIEFTLPANVLDALSASYDDLVITVALNVPSGATGTYLLDNLRLGGVSACDFSCPGGVCNDGICEIECSAGYGDCDGNAENGCETPVDADSVNCGACGVQCGAGTLCSAGACVPSAACGPTEADCDGNASNQCEVDLATDVAHCGACGAACGAGQVCMGGQCLAGDLDATVQLDSDWGQGYCARLLLTNSGNAPTTTWRVVLDPRGATLSVWSANVVVTSGTVALTPLAWNSVILPGTTDGSVGFCATRHTGNQLPVVLGVEP